MLFLQPSANSVKIELAFGSLTRKDSILARTVADLLEAFYPFFETSKADQ
jgi:hypothetical protein